MMPKVSEFFGIAIAMYYSDHAPPHFHARYGEHEAVIGIDPLTLREGALPKRALGMVLEWASGHPAELAENWELARNGLPLKMIPPLE